MVDHNLVSNLITKNSWDLFFRSFGEIFGVDHDQGTEKFSKNFRGPEPDLGPWAPEVGVTPLGGG